MSLLDCTAVELAAKIKAGEVTAVEAMQAVVAQIEKSEDKLNCYVTFDKEKALQAAAKADDDIKAGKLTGPLAGVPFAIKDNMCTEGMLTTCSSKILGNFVPTFSSEAVIRLQEAGACNIVPNSTGAAKAIGLVIPELNGKLIGAAQRVPTPTGSTTILNAVVAKKVTVDEVNAAMKAAATESFGYNEELIVSSDIVGMRFGSLFDATQTMVNELPNGGCQVQVVSWYDNENSYTSQMVRTIKYFAELN